MKPKFDHLIHSVPIAFKLWTGKAWRRRSLEWAEALIEFFESNGLTQRRILKRGEKVGKDTEILGSHLNAEGYQVASHAMKRWYRAFEGEKPLNTGILYDVLAKVRSGKAPVVPEFSVSIGGADDEADDEPATEFDESEPDIYDRAKWHFEGDFPEELDEEQAYVYTGMLVTWLAEKGFVRGEFLPEAKRIKAREIIGKQAYQIWDGGLDSNMLTEEGNAFAKYYIGHRYDKDYQKALCRSLPTIYHVKDTRRNYNRLKPLIEERYQAWKKKRRR